MLSIHCSLGRVLGLGAFVALGAGSLAAQGRPWLEENVQRFTHNVLRLEDDVLRPDDRGDGDGVLIFADRTKGVLRSALRDSFGAHYKLEGIALRMPFASDVLPQGLVMGVIVDHAERPVGYVEGRWRADWIDRGSLEAWIYTRADDGGVEPAGSLAGVFAIELDADGALDLEGICPVELAPRVSAERMPLLAAFGADTRYHDPIGPPDRVVRGMRKSLKPDGSDDPAGFVPRMHARSAGSISALHRQLWYGLDGDGPILGDEDPRNSTGLVNSGNARGVRPTDRRYAFERLEGVRAFGGGGGSSDVSDAGDLGGLPKNRVNAAPDDPGSISSTRVILGDVIWLDGAGKSERLVTGGDCTWSGIDPHVTAVEDAGSLAGAGKSERLVTGGDCTFALRVSWAMRR